MKSELQIQPKTKYPVLERYQDESDHDFIVLFTANTVGTVVQVAKSTHHDLGKHCVSWDSEETRRKNNRLSGRWEILSVGAQVILTQE